MRPLLGEETFPGRSRSSSDNDATPLAIRTQPPQMTYFLADEHTMEASLSRSESEERLRLSRHNFKKNLGQHMSRHAEEEPDSPSLGTISRPFTPISFGSPAPISVMSSPDSRRGSDVGSYILDDVASQAVLSSGEDEVIPTDTLMDSGSAPQLVMPSIKMPSRRPFTERGKNLGRLKVLIAGDSGVGKTSLIKAIVQICEDIVHVDALSTAPIPPLEHRRRSRTKSRSGSADVQATSHITEVYASTRPYPAWWSDLEESKVLRRRKSMGDAVLERNLCFVDTPGYGNKTSCLECITPVVEYVEAQFKKATALESASESDMLNMMSGNGGSQVDLVLYVIYHRIKPVDIEYLQRLSHLTNVIPLIAQADTLAPEQISDLKKNISSELLRADIRPFTGLAPDCDAAKPTAPFAISTNPSKDLEAMDASLLMSPDYVQPLIESELPALVSQIFDRDAISWLRHSAAKKFVQWRASATPVSRPQSLYRPLGSGFVSSSQSLTAPVGATTSYALARITDHTQREERIAQVRLANWAADLQRSLQNERMRFDELARSERAVWLTERLGECVQDGTIVAFSEARKDHRFDPESTALVKKGSSYRRKQGMGSSLGVDKHDPLGLLQLNRDMKRRAWVVVKIMGGFGILGGFAYWLVKGIQGEDVAVWGMGGLTVRDMIDFGVLDWRT